MAKNWYDKHDVEERFGWSFRQFKTRLSYLDLVISGHYQGGNGQAYKVDENGLTLLGRQFQLEQEGRGVKEAARTIISELNNGQKKGNKENVKVSEGDGKEVIKQLEKRLDEKDERIKGLLEDKQYWKSQAEELQQKLLTGETMDEKENPYKDKSLWQVVKEWLKSPAG